MNLRTKSPAWQWGVWSIAALVAAAAYVVGTRLFLGCAVGDLLGEAQQRMLLPILVVLGIFAYETRWSGVRQEEQDETAEKTDTASEEEIRPAPVPQPQEKSEPKRERTGEPSPAEAPAQATDSSVARVSAPLVVPQEQEEPPSGTGEAEYVLARTIPHQVVPDYSQPSDGRYLELLGRSAACGYPEALAKLGEYAVRREAWVEAYFWTWRARRAGMKGLESVLRSIRLSWVMEGYPDEEDNVHRLFSPEDGSAGRALLNIDTGRELLQARAYLQTYYPELLD